MKKQIELLKVYNNLRVITQSCKPKRNKRRSKKTRLISPTHGKYHSDQLAQEVDKSLVKSTPIKKYRIERLLERDISRKGVFYLVKWAEYSKEYNSWEPETNLIKDGNQALIDKFNKRNIGPYAFFLKKDKYGNRVYYV